MSRYRNLLIPSDHPFAKLLALQEHRPGWVLVGEHRLVLYAAIGEGPHSCHWCGRQTDWCATGIEQLITDHLDDDGYNNDPANLVPACRTCNARRPGTPVFPPSHGRGRWGQQNGRAVLSAEQVQEMRRLYSQGVKVVDLMAMFGLKKAQTYKILNGTSWVS